jgi:serine/threonine protein kinase
MSLLMGDVDIGFRPDMSMAMGVSCALIGRAAVVPSHSTRTAVIGVLSGMPVLVATLLTHLHTDPAARVMTPAVVTSQIGMWLVFAVILSTTISQVIYGLSKQVEEATRLGQYTLERKIGEGGMGVVYLARHALLRRPTAIKLLAPGRTGEHALERFEREVQTTSLLRHPNTVAIYDYGRTPEGVFYYAMEYLDGIDLEHLVEHEGPLPEGRVVYILVQVARALSEAHRAGLIHRDVKPSNVLLCDHGDQPDFAKVLDFGLVKELAGANAAASTADALTGTPLYMSPEAIVEPSTIDARSDLYALGCILHLMLTAAPAFDAPTREQMIKKRLSENPPHAQELDPGIPDSIDRVIAKLLARTPDDRYGSAAEVRDALSGTHVRRLSSDGTPLPRKETPRSADTIVFGTPTPEQKTPPPEPGLKQTPVMATRAPVRTAERRRWPWVLGVLAIIAIAWSTYARVSREGREQRYAQARLDSARRADSTRQADSARADSLNASLVGGMVDSARLAEEARRDSIANAQNALRNAVVAGIRSYTNAIQRGDLAAARQAFPRVSESELAQWQRLLQQGDLRIRVLPPSKVELSEGNVIADADVFLEVQSIDRGTRAPMFTNRLPRHAQLSKQGRSWRLEEFRAR